MPEILTNTLQEFAPISLGEMKDVSLMRRVDTKYVVHSRLLASILGHVTERYRALEIAQLRTMRYESQYFDTLAYRFFNDHHNGKAGRTKIRKRTYVDSDLSFLEIKYKDAKGVTKKKRMAVEGQSAQLSTSDREFIDRQTNEEFELQSTIRNRFRRLTLVDIDRSERVTFDWDLSSALGSAVLEHDDLAIVEIKQGRFDRHAPIVKALRAVGARPYRVSKYCLGMTCLRAGLKMNRFKQKLLHINNITSPVNYPAKG